MGEWPLRRSVLLSISGGRDSVSLLYAMLEAGIRPVLFHCNYRLRGEDSTLDAALVADLAFQNDLCLETVQVPDDWKNHLNLQGINLQDAARRYRYNALRGLSGPQGKFPGAIVTTAHHAMDQAETVLLALLKGRNIHRLSGLQSSPGLWRPWLEIMPSELEAYAQAKALHFRQDRSNDSDYYDRNYVRLHLAPIIYARFPGWVQGILRASRQIQECETVLAEFSKTSLEPFVERIQDSCWGKVVRLRQESSKLDGASVFAGSLWRSLGANYVQEQALEQAWDLSVGKVLGCGKGQVFRQRNALCYLERLPHGQKLLQEWKIKASFPNEVAQTIKILEGAVKEQTGIVQAYAELGHEFFLTQGDSIPLDWSSWVAQGWQVRPWVAGDRCSMIKGHRKLVSDLLQEHRIERPFKDTWPVICLDKEVIGCPLPSMTPRWEMKGGEGVLEWEWKSKVMYATIK